MPKPFMGVSANGCHHNFSLWRGDENAFCPTPTTRRSRARSACWAIGGIIEHLRALTAVTASTVNSYRRLWDTGFWAPVFKDWGWQNRTTALARVGTAAASSTAASTRRATRTSRWPR